MRLIPPFESFSFKSLVDLKQRIKELGLEIPFNSNTKILKSGIKIKEKLIPNRLSIQPMEGFDANLDGSPGNLTVRRYKRYAKSGVALIWFEATAITKNCRSNEHQLVINNKNFKKFQDLVSTVKDECNSTLKSLGFKDQCLLILQLNHSGRYTRMEGKRFPIRTCHNPELDSTISVSNKEGIIISDNELERLERKWIEKAILTKEIGFDGVDIKACHGYLISELLSSRSRKNSQYGGNLLENRSRFFFNIIERLKKKIGEKANFIISTRLGIYDGIPYPNGFGIKLKKNESYPAPFDLSEPIKIISRLYNYGIRIINITCGNPHFKPYVTRPFNKPIKGGNYPPEHPLYGVNRIIKLTSMIKTNIPDDMVIIGSGYSYLRHFAGFVAAGLITQKKVDMCGFGRMAFANPEFARQIFQKGMINKNKTCLTCSKCSELMKNGKSTGCVIRDPKYKLK